MTDREEHGGRPTLQRARQKRASDRYRGIADSAARVIAAHGVAGVTHRLVAEEAGVPLAATTYHFQTKSDIIHAASRMTLKAYDSSFRRALDRFRDHSGSPQAFQRYVQSLIRNTAGKARERAICWGEIMLDAPRHPEGLPLTQSWFAQTVGHFEEMLQVSGVDHARLRALGAIDILIGILILTVGLGLSERQVSKILVEDEDVLEFRPDVAASPQRVATVRTGAKAIATRSKILAATIEILKVDGPGAVNSRTVSEAAGVTRAAPFYYFPSVADLLAAAQSLLFSRSKDRYRRGLTEMGGIDPDLDSLIDRTAAVFLREATEYSAESIASYSIWLRADQQTAVRAMTWEAAADQHLSWRSIVARWKATPAAVDPLLCQALFIGKLVRTLATGSRIEELSTVRRQFATNLTDILSTNPVAP